MGQVKQKKQLTTADYHLWSTLQLSDISKNGKWISHLIRYESGLDTLVVTSKDGKRRFSYPKGTKGKFCGNKWFACLLDKNRLQLTNLMTGKSEYIESVREFEFSNNEKYLIGISKNKELKTLAFKNLFTGTSEKIANVSAWRFANDRSKIAYCVQNDLNSTIKVRSFSNSLIHSDYLLFTNQSISNIVWHENNKSFVFVMQSLQSEQTEKTNTIQLGLYRLTNQKLFLLDPNKTKGFPKRKHINSVFPSDLCISADGNRILFQVIRDSLTDNNQSPLVEVWNGNDKRIYSERKVTGNLADWPTVAVWYPDSSQVFDFMPQETHVMLSGDQRFALSSNLESCEPQLKYSADRDFYLTDLISRQRKLWLSCHAGDGNTIIMSPSGNYILYFKDKNWFSYNTRTFEHINLTQKSGIAYFDETNDVADEPGPYGLAGWSKEDKSVFFYDAFDLWEFSTDGTSMKCLTNGREKNISLRIAKDVTNTNTQIFLSVVKSDVIDLERPVFLTGTTIASNSNSYHILEQEKLKPLIFSSSRLGGLRKATNAEIYVYTVENYEQPPKLELQDGRKSNPFMLFQSNSHYKDYEWGKSRIITYTNSQSKELKGLLFYPSNYTKGKSYPMIVHIYEKQFAENLKYVNPTILNADGFNLTNWVTQGYFVLLPDIEYKLNSPGDSALDCVTSVVKKVLSIEIVNPNKIGLIGHSFGGYETSYILTKSNIFATAIAGAPQTNYVSSYLDISANYKKAEFWRYEYSTNRMNKPLFDSMDNYIHNSPVFNSANITTPLLIWTGSKDLQVSQSQSMELYLALRRLGKKVIMLRYPDEGHSLHDSIKQIDLTQKIIEWFDFYLKDKPISHWMRENVNP